MAKRRRTATKTKIIRVGAAPRQASPIIRVQAPRAAPARRVHHRRRAPRASIGGGLISNEQVQQAIGGALYGFAVKSGWVGKLPAIPIVGRTGTAALLLGYWARHGGGTHVRSAANAAAAIAGYQLGSTGVITGDTAEGDASTPGSLAGDDGYQD